MKKKKRKIIHRTSTKKSVKKIPVLQAKSNSTGIVHSFGNPKVWLKVIESFESKYQSKEKADLITALSFNNFLQFKNISITPKLKLSESIFRIVSTAYEVWSLAGSLSDGGRFNIGGAQQCATIPHLKKFASLYTASTLECAMAEIAKPMGYSRCFKLTPKKEMELWDLNKVIEELDHPTLKDLVNSIPTEAIWGFQKVPLVSQILAAYLKSKGGDGIIFPSVKLPSAYNISLFFDTDRQVKETFVIEDIKPINEII